MTGTMSEHRAMWKAQRETQGLPCDDDAWQEWLFDRFLQLEDVRAVIVRLKPFNHVALRRIADILGESGQ